MLKCDLFTFICIITPVFSVTSFRNHSNMRIWCSRNIFCYSQCCKTVVPLHISMENVILTWRAKFKEPFTNIINVFTVISNQLNAALLNISINFFQKIK